MSRPFAIAALGLLLALAVLTLGELTHSKGAVPVAFLVGGTMMLGGLAVGLMRSIPRGANGANIRLQRTRSAGR